jgi:hypothetical protein
MYTGEQLMAVFAELANGEGDQSGKAKPGAPL